MTHDINSRLVYLVNSYYKLYVRIPLDQLNDLLSLRTDPVVCGHNQNNNIGHISPTGAHCGERCMSGSIQEGDILKTAPDGVRDRDREGTDMLGDTSSLSLRHRGRAKGIQ